MTIGNPFLLGGTTYVVPVPALRGNGSYTLAIGPGVADIAGRLMDQNQDGTNGDPANDVFHASFVVALPALVVDTLTPQASAGHVRQLVFAHVHRAQCRYRCGTRELDGQRVPIFEANPRRHGRVAKKL